MIEVKYHRGIELPESGLWLDPADAKALAFVSHAHSDHIAGHAEIISSFGTARLMQSRLPGVRREHLLKFLQPSTVRGLKVTLLPAGHIFGSAQLFLQTEAGSLLYTGDFKLRPGLSAEPAQWCQAETLVMETTYGLPKYRMPPTEETLARMVEFCREALEEKAVPVLLGYSLGKSQEILCALLKAGLTPMLHGAVWRMTEIYSQLEPDFPKGSVPYRADQIEGKVLVCPPSAARSVMVRRLKARRTAVLTGWALDPGATYRYQVDAAFPLTDHADYDDLLRYVELVQPRRVLTLHGFASAFARDLRARGVEAWALSQENQLEFALAHEAAAPKVWSIPAPTRPVSNGFRALAETAEQINATPRKLRKIELLANYLSALPERELGIATVYFSGHAFAQTDPRTLQVGWALIKRALLSVSTLSESRFRELAHFHSDAGKLTQEVLAGQNNGEPWPLEDSYKFFSELERARGPLQKGDLLQERLRTLSALEASYLVRIITGDLRIGLKEGLVEDAIATAFAAEPEQVRAANMLTGDLGKTAQLAASDTLHLATLQLFRPIKCMLASPEPSSEAIWSRIAGTGEWWAEEKFDGIRAQLHLGNGRAELFTRDLRKVSGQFGDLLHTIGAAPKALILDGEILAQAPDRKLTFFDLQKRLGREQSDDLFLGSSDIPVVFKAFDLLWLDGVSLLNQPLEARRKQLEALGFERGIEMAAITRLDSAATIEMAFTEARRAGNEGLVLKEASSVYTPGRRGLSWLKLKKELATLDVVVIGAETGHGRRSHLLSDLKFAVRDDVSGEFLPIGKAYSGLTDCELEELTEHFKATTIVQHGRYREVRPEIVLEVAFDSVQPSTRHSSGLALRFPRIKAIRRDKLVSEIDSLSDARRLV